jgi:hypothetical protein
MPVNVKDRGAVGDGAADDTVAIQAAIDGVAALGGGTVFFPPGDYVVNGGLRIAPDRPTRLLGSGMALNSNGSSPWPTRLIRTSGTTTMLTAIGSSYAIRVWLELSDIEMRGGGSAGMLVDVQVGNTVQFHRVRFAGAAATGLRMRNVFNSSGSHLRWQGCGSGTAAPACLFDGVSGEQGGSDTVQWSHLQFEGNGGTDLKLTGNAANESGTVTTSLQMSQIKMEGGTQSAVDCPYLDLDYTQGCIFSDVNIGVHHGRRVTPLRKSHPFGGTRTDKFVNLHIDNVGSEAFPFGIEHSKGALQLENVSILGPSVAAIKIHPTVGASEFQLGKLVTNAARAVIDSRTALPTVESAATISPPRSGLVAVAGSTTITAITPHEAGYVMTLKFDGALTVVEGPNLRLAGNFTTSGDDTLTLVSSGFGWYEVARSAN